MRNIFDEEYRTAAQDLALALGFSEIVYGMPRVWGIQVQHRFQP